MLLIDTNEPISDIVPLIGQSVELGIQPLNVAGYADYKWTKHDGTEKQVERKTWPELLSNPDHIEEQLLRHLNKNPTIELVFMLEGMVQQGEIGTYTIRNSRSGVWAKDHTYTVRLKRVYSLLYAASKYVEIMHTSSIVESATCLVAMYEYDQKAIHETFNRHIKQTTFNPNPLVTTLMGMGNGLGDKRATALIEEYGTPFNILTAGWYGPPAIPTWQALTLIPGIGEGIIKNLLRGVGRPDL